MLMRYIRTFAVLFFLVGIIIGYWLQSMEFIVTDEQIVKINTHTLEDVDIVEVSYDNNQLIIRIEIESVESINSILKGKIHLYYSVIEQAFSNKLVDSINVIVQKQEEKLIVFQYTRKRFNQIDRDMGQEFFKRHIKTKGWDVLNNADNYRISKDCEKYLHEDLKDRLINLN